VADGLVDGFDGLAGEITAAHIDNGPGDEQGNFFASLFEEGLDGEDGGFGVEGVEDGFDDEQVCAAVEQAAGGFIVGGGKGVEVDVAVAGVVDVGGEGGGAVGWA
jgi:hypothetical protein